MTTEAVVKKGLKRLLQEPTIWTVLPSSSIHSSMGAPTPLIKSSDNRGHILRQLIEDGYWVKATGSRVTKDGWTDASDWDYVVYDPDRKLVKKLIEEGDWLHGSLVDHGEFASLKKNDINLIIVDQEEIWKKYIIATNLIKALNSKTKEERIKVFDSVFGRDSNAKAVEF